MVQLSHPYMTIGKTIALPIWTFVGKVMSLLFNMLSRFVTAFFPRIKHLLISWLQSPSTVILESKKRKSVTIFTFSLSIYCEVMGPDAMILIFWMLSFKAAFSLSSFTLTKRLFRSASLFAKRYYYVGIGRNLGSDLPELILFLIGEKTEAHGSRVICLRSHGNLGLSPIFLTPGLKFFFWHQFFFVLQWWFFSPSFLQCLHGKNLIKLVVVFIPLNVSHLDTRHT